MKKVLAAVAWYFAPAYQVVHESRSRVSPIPWLLRRRFLLHTLPRLAVLAAFVWMLTIGNWLAAAVLAVLMVGLGLMHWLVARWLMARLGGRHATG